MRSEIRDLALATFYTVGTLFSSSCTDFQPISKVKRLEEPTPVSTPTSSPTNLETKAIILVTPVPSPTPIITPVLRPIPIAVENDPYLKSIYNASSLEIRRIKDNAYGTGFLVDKNGELSIYTVGHVIRDALRGEAIFAYENKKVSIANFTPQDFEYHPATSKQDVIVSYKIDKEKRSVLDNYINQNLLRPLKISPELPLEGETLVAANPELGIFDHYRFIGFDFSYFLQELEVNKGYVCQGRSGTPVLRVRGGTITNEVVGIISSIRTLDMKDPMGRNRKCSFLTEAVPTR